MNKSCKKCGLNCTLARDLAKNGSTQVFFWCNRCWNYADPFRAFVPHAELESNNVGIDTLPIIDRWPDEVRIKCDVAGCDNEGVELHHWAPKHLFPNAELWPTNYLCTPHHKEWHDKITPKMRQRVNGNGSGVHANQPIKA